MPPSRSSNLLTTELRTRTAPEVNATLEQARNSLAAAETTMHTNSPLQNRLLMTMDELARAAGAMRNLMDYLERNPQSLLTGKDAPK